MNSHKLLHFYAKCAIIEKWAHKNVLQGLCYLNIIEVGHS